MAAGYVVPIHHEQQVVSRGFADKSSYVPDTKPHPDLPELRRLEEVEKRLARKYGLPEGPFADSAEILQEAKNRVASSQRGVRRYLGRHNESASNIEDLENLLRLYYLRFELAKLPTNIKPARHPAEDGSRFWAVLIGIDAYEPYALRGCVSDALLMKSFLTEDLHIPEERIQCLLTSNDSTTYSSTPSRYNIVDTFYSLIDNPEIQYGDNIIIYYAGHGSTYHCLKHPDGVGCSWTCGPFPIEALCPLDRDTIDSGGRLIPDISDREVNALFAAISHAKGHKITYIADCCYAGGMDRGPEPGIRAIPPIHRDVNDMLRIANQKMKYPPGYQSVLSRDWRPDMDSHVILAACRDFQTAKETCTGKGYVGHFTKILVDVLRSPDWKSLEDKTYVELINRLNISPFQTPVVAGRHKNERLWYPDAVAE